MPEHLKIWAKWRERDCYHPLFCHMIDVASVAARLNRTQVGFESASLRPHHLLSDVEHLPWVTFLAGLHDLGKASPAFQVHPNFRSTEVDVVRQRLANAGLPFPRLRDRRGRTRQVSTPHGVITASVLPDILREQFGFSPEAAGVFALITGAHHGRFPTAAELHRVTVRAAGDGPWRDLRLAMAGELASVIGVPIRPPVAPDPATAVAIAGFISVADWIGSMEKYFPYAVSRDSDIAAFDLRAYAADSARRAEHALRDLHWLGDTGLSTATSFEALFPELSPNALQRGAIEVASDLSDQSLVIIEAPMGDGKTEAAMYLAQHFAARVGQDGCYFALPTQATSNQMFSRLRAFLATARVGEANLQLLHGHAALSAEFQTLRERAGEVLPTAVYGEEDADAAESTVVAAEWFTYRKRGLLAPFGVGTVDQALMAVLQTRHYFVRLFGLSGKTIVIDEVHAYDAYMTTLMERLLEWLASLGSSVVLLSATLPSERRKALTAAYLRGLGVQAESAINAAYPRLTWANASGQSAREIPASERSRRRIALEWLESASLGERLVSLLSDGGCAAVICNTVDRAQKLYRSLRQFFPDAADDGEPELMLFHARYPFEDRDDREKRALVRFGKEGASVDFGESVLRKVKRPLRAVIVATQVIEQSLDLDFDVMISEFAPVDLILQRAGRMHRHQRTRPESLASPRMLLIRPDLRDGTVPDFGGGTEAVYDRHILLRSWIAISNREFVDVPSDVEPLIEYAYGEQTECPNDASPELRAAWFESASKLESKRERYEGLAKRNRISAPGDKSLFEENTALDEDSPDLHPSLQALTRLSEVPEVSVVALSADEIASFNPRREPHREEAIALLRRELKIAHRGVAPALIHDDSESRLPPGWRRSPLLRHHRLLRLDASGRERIGDYELLVDSELGVVISWLGERDESDAAL